MSQRFLSSAALARLVADRRAAGTRVIAPVRAADDASRVGYAPIETLADAAFGVAIPRRSLKEFFLPASEVLLQYTQTKDGVTIQAASAPDAPQLILGPSPCDVAALEIVDKVMNWDYRDELWNARRQASTIVSLLCATMDATCFCTAVALGPDATRGADVLLVPVTDGYLAELVTAKGETLLANYATALPNETLAAEAAQAAANARAKVEHNLPALPEGFATWLEGNFNHDIWQTLALRCHGCGACAALCPTCHCFDIVDEHTDSAHGVRRRNWDSCQTAKFTVHSSGYNPRASQTERFRQRVEHKFSIYSSRFGEVLCTGCGRCSRLCPSGMNLAEVLSQLSSLKSSDSEENAR